MKRLIVTAGLLVSALCLASWFGPTAAANHITKCFGERADVNRSHDPSGSFLVGTAGHDVIIGSADTDRIEGRAAATSSAAAVVGTNSWEAEGWTSSAGQEEPMTSLAVAAMTC